MDLIERYLGAIRRSLPARNADDIVAELRDALASRIEEREDMLGRPLTPEEVEASIKAFGHPLIVAARYRKQQWLIGPDVYPFYLSVLRIVLMLVALLLVVVAAVNLLFNRQDLLHALGGALGGLWVSLPINFAVVTIVFVALERAGFPADYLRKWDPSQLADAGDEQPSPWKSAAEVALSIAFLLWWSSLFTLPYSVGSADFRIEPAPIFSALYWPIFALASARLVHNLIQWLRPRWRLVRALIGGATAIGGLVLAALIYRAGHWATIIPTGMPVRQAIELQNSLDLALKIALVVVAVVWTFQCLQALWLIGRARAQRLPG